MLDNFEIGKNTLDISSDLAISLPCAAEQRSRKDDQKTDIFDIEVIIKVDGTEKSAAAINIKFSYLDNQSFHMSPEMEHDNPWLFVIDKNTLNEFLVPSETGKEYISGIGGERSQYSMEEFLQEITSGS